MRVLPINVTKKGMVLKTPCARAQAIVHAYFRVIPRKLLTAKFVSKITSKFAKIRLSRLIKTVIRKVDSSFFYVNKPTP